MPSLLIVTHIDFWRNGAGHRTRISSLITFLKNKVRITLVYAGIFDHADEHLLNEFYPEITVEVLEKRKLSYKEYRVKFEHYVKGRIFDFALVEYIEMSFVLPFLDGNCITLLDTHDLVGDRIKSFRNHNLPYTGIELTVEEEFEIFQCFDYVLVIQKVDYAKLTKEMEPDRVLLVPHPSHSSKKGIRKSVHHIGYIASGYSPNIDALTWFLQNVWPSLYQEYGITFNVYGDVCNKLSEDLITHSIGVNFHGFTSDLDLVYNKCDILINPVRCGAGLKIKNVEALGNGLPLVTTTHGAVGIEDGLNTSFLVADTAEGFAGCIRRLIQDFDLRLQIGNRAFEYAEVYFSAEKCYQPLLNTMLTNHKI